MVEDEPSGAPEARAAASFLMKALGVSDDPDAIAADLLRVAHEPPVTTFAVEFAASDGPAAFLVYVHELHARDGAGATGRELLAGALETLAEAERLGAPGPRAVASAEVDRWGLLLATTPEVYARLARTEVVSAAGAVPSQKGADGRQGAETLAEELLASLRETNRLAEAYLAVHGGRPEGSAAEAELALHLTDGRSLASLLALVRRVVGDANDTV